MKYKTSNALIKSSLIIFYISAFIIQILIILKVIPFSWVNGGMSKTYEDQFIQSSISLFIITVLARFVIKTSSQTNIVSGLKLKALYGITLLWAFGLFMQLAGTVFERYVLSFILLFGALSHIQFIKHIRAKQYSR